VSRSRLVCSPDNKHDRVSAPRGILTAPDSRTQRPRVSQIATVLSVIVLTALGCVGVNAQPKSTAGREERDRGIQLYTQGDFGGATQSLRAAVKRYKDDLSAWHYLGLALEQKGDTSAARKAFEQAARIGDHTLQKRLDQTETAREVSSALLSIQSELVKAAESAEKYLALNSKLSKSKREEWVLRAETLRGFAALARGGLEVYSGKEVTTKPRVLSKPEPLYTEEARKNQVAGIVVLRCVFAANGRVLMCRVLSGLSDGLTESALASARRITFNPATKDGKPVSTWMELQYHFNLY
jgi:TonB family protein